jgi:hypothetical protein
MDNRETPAEYKDKYQLIFVGEVWSDNPLYESWAEGRIEIRTWDDEHCNNEIRYCNERSDNDFWEFQKRYNCKWLTASELEEFKRTVQEKFRKKPK